MEWRTRERWQAIYLEVKEDDDEYQIKKKKEKMLAQKSVKSKLVLLVGWLMVQLKGR